MFEIRISFAEILKRSGEVYRIYYALLITLLVDVETK